MLKKGDTEKVLEKRFPEAVALVVSKSKEGKVTVCPIGYFSLAAFAPKTWAISVYREHSTNKFIKATNEFVLCLPSMGWVDDVLASGSGHYDKDKVKKLKFKFLNVSNSGVPIIDGSIACFVCKVVKEVDVGDHTTFFGEIVESYDSDKEWKEKIYNWDNKTLGSIKYGEMFKRIGFSPEGAVKSK